MRIVKGNLLSSNADIIGHQVNCKGVMGAGVAKQLANKYPTLLREYKKALSSLPSPLGKVYMHLEGGKHIANVFAQEGYGRYGVHTDYVALEKGLKSVASYARKHNLSVALPYGIGCGLAGGDWNIVFPMLDRLFEGVDCTLYKL